MVNNRTEVINANGRLALEVSKTIRSTQYSVRKRNADIRIAVRAHGFALKRLQSRTAPATAQPAPVMDKYSGLRRASNSYNTSHQRRAANSRIVPQADRLNTNHRSRVTPKGRLRSMIRSR